MFLFLIQSYRNAFGGLSKYTWYLSFVMLVNRSGTMVVPFMTMYLTQKMGVSLDKAGLVMALFGLGSITGSLAGGRLTDKFGFHSVQLIALVGGGVLFIILGQLKSFPLICAGTFLLSFVNESFRPANHAAIAWFSNEENRTRSYVLNRLAINLGWAAGGALGGFLAAKNYELLFWVDGVTNLAAAALLFLLIPATHTQPEAVKHTPGIEQPTGSAYTDKPFIWFSVFIALFAICFFQSFSTLPVFYKEEWQLNEVTIGYIMALNGLVITFVEMPFVKYAEGRMPALYFVAIGTVVVAFSYMVLNLLPGSVMAALVSIMLFTVGEIIAMPFMNTYWTSRSNAANRGQYAALYTAAFSIAHVTGPYTGSQLAHHQGFAVLWWATGALCLLTALGFRFVHHKTDRP